jgi:hypothetical protein
MPGDPAQPPEACPPARDEDFQPDYGDDTGEAGQDGEEQPQVANVVAEDDTARTCQPADSSIPPAQSGQSWNGGGDWDDKNWKNHGWGEEGKSWYGNEKRWTATTTAESPQSNWNERPSHSHQWHTGKGNYWGKGWSKGGKKGGKGKSRSKGKKGGKGRQGSWSTSRGVQHDVRGCSSQRGGGQYRDSGASSSKERAVHGWEYKCIGNAGPRRRGPGFGIRGSGSRQRAVQSWCERPPTWAPRLRSPLGSEPERQPWTAREGQQ